MRCTNLVAKGIDGSNSIVDKIFDQTFIVQDITKESCREVIFESSLFCASGGKTRILTGCIYQTIGL